MTASIFAPYLNSLILFVLTVLSGVIGAAIRKYVKDAAMQTILSAALSRASGVALAYGQARGDQFLQDTTVKSAAHAAALNYVADQAKPALDHFNQSSADLATKVSAEIATALSLATPIPSPASATLAAFTPTAVVQMPDATASAASAESTPTPAAAGAIPVTVVGASS